MNRDPRWEKVSGEIRSVWEQTDPETGLWFYTDIPPQVGVHADEYVEYRVAVEYRGKYVYRIFRISRLDYDQSFVPDQEKRVLDKMVQKLDDVLEGVE